MSNSQVTKYSLKHPEAFADGDITTYPVATRIQICTILERIEEISNVNDWALVTDSRNDEVEYLKNAIEVLYSLGFLNPRQRVVLQKLLMDAKNYYSF